MPPAAALLADATAHDVLHWVPRHDPGLADRMAAVAGWIRRARPALVVVDVSVEIAVLGRLCGVPVVVLAMPGVRTDRTHSLAYDLADALLAPWPETAHTDGLAPVLAGEALGRRGAVALRRPRAGPDAW